jgi:hypothetical protein
VRGRTRQFAALMLLITTLAPVAAVAQEVEERPVTSGYRRYLYAVVGAAIGAVPAMIATPGKGDAVCASRGCNVALAGSLGLAVGYMIGTEKDQLAARRALLGPALEVRSRAIGLKLVPESMSTFEGGVAIAGAEGAAILQGDDARPRAGQMRGINAVAAIPTQGALLAATTSGLFAFPFTDDTAGGRLVLRGPVTAFSTFDGDRIALVAGTSVRGARLGGSGVAIEASETGQATTRDDVVAIAHDASTQIFWTVEGDRLVARAGDSFTERGALDLPGTGRTISLLNNIAAIAAGSDGVFLVDISQSATPRLLGTSKSIQFAYDAELIGDQMYVAAGPFGLQLVDVKDPAAPRVVGLGREFGFIIDLDIGSDGRLLALDRTGKRLHVVEVR